MNKEQQDKLWLELSEENRERIINDYLDLLSDNGKWINDYTDEERGGAIAQIEWTFGAHNLKPTLTYGGMTKELFKNGAWQVAGREYPSEFVFNEGANEHYFLNCTSEKQGQKLLAISRLLNVAKYLNGDWKPDWEDCRQGKYGIDITDGDITVTHTATYQTSIVYFRTQELAEQAIQILGEETIILALTTDY